MLKIVRVQAIWCSSCLYMSKVWDKVMKNKNIESLESLLEQYIENGGKITACTMSMDVMGIKKDELIENIEYGGVATYMENANKANHNLFI